MPPKPSSLASAWRRGLAAAAIASLLGGCLVDSASADAEAGRAALRVAALPSAAVTQAAQAAVASVHADAQPDQIDRALTEQAFAVQGGARVLYLVPVTFASKKARNGVCDLVVMDEQFKVTGRTRLFGPDFDGDEVVARCTNVLAAAFRPRLAQHRLDGVYLMATGVINTARNAAEVVTIDTETGAVKADDKLTAAIDDGKEPTTLAPLMARLKRQP